MADTYDDRYSHSESSIRYMKQWVSESAPNLDGDDNSSERKKLHKPSFWTSAVAGGVAGVVVDFTLYPLDTIKTRHQSEEGFRASGGFKKLYKGIIPVMLCSGPLSALFFCVYNSLVNALWTKNSILEPAVYFVAASTAELACSSVRIPLEVVKQRKQTSNKTTYYIVKKALQTEGFLGLYRGFSSTISREIPFACIQYPLWEYFLNQLIIYKNGEPLTALETACCGAISGATAGILTTPVDVIRTRVMLAEKEKIDLYRPKVYRNFIREIYLERGMGGFFSGVIPRTLWIMFGGFIFFGAYEEAKLICKHKWCYLKSSIEKVRGWVPDHFYRKLSTLLEAYACTESMQEKPVFSGEMEGTAQMEGGDNLLPFQHEKDHHISSPSQDEGNRSF